MSTTRETILSERDTGNRDAMRQDTLVNKTNDEASYISGVELFVDGGVAQI